MDLTPTTIATLIAFIGLFLRAMYLIRGWKKGWETRLTAQDDRLKEHDDRHADHDVIHERFKTQLEHITDVTTETRTDVKELLRHSNGKRSTG